MSGKRTCRDNMATMSDESLQARSLLSLAKDAETFSEINGDDFSPAEDQDETISTMSDDSLQARGYKEEQL